MYQWKSWVSVPKKRKERHLSDKTTSLLEQRGAMKRRDPTSDANRSEYSRLNKLVKKSCKADDNAWALRIASDLEQAASRGQQREVWQRIKVLSNKKKKSAAVRDKSGKLIADPEAQKKRWKEYFAELLNPPSVSNDLSELDALEPEFNFTYLSESDEPPSHTEISNALKKLKNYKTPGIDGIANEQLKYGEVGIINQLCSLFEKVWNEENIPEDWSKGVIVPIGKKGDTSYCSNSRGITLRSTASKLYQIIILQRMQTGLEELLRENQCGFRRNRSCIDQIYSLKRIIDNCIDYNIPLYLNFVDFKAAFDSINRDYIWKCLRQYGLPSKYVRIIQAFFTNTASAVRVDGDLTEWFDVKSGTGQGDIHGPPIFNVCLNLAASLTEANKNISKGLILQHPESNQLAKTILDTDYADDMAVLDNLKDGLQESSDLLSKHAGSAGLHINTDKTKSMATGKNTTQKPYTEACSLDINVDGKPIDQVSHFQYLGFIISSDGTIDRELSVRIQKASGAFNQLNNIWNNRNIRTPTKIRIYKAAVLTILLYGAEVWSTTQKQMKMFSVFHQRCLRRILRIKWYHKVKNEDVLSRASMHNIDVFISALRLRWYGHVVRMPEHRLPKYLLDWKPKHGKRSRGRPRKTWMDCVREDAAHFTGIPGIADNDMAQHAQNRQLWRDMIRRNRERKCDAGHSND